MYYRNSQAAVVVYDIQNRDSFQRAKSWVTTLKNQVNNLSFSFRFVLLVVSFII